MKHDKRVLVVENYSDLLMMIAESMRQRAYPCEAVQDFDEAIERIQTDGYTSILLDVTWPIATNPVIRYLRSERPDELRKLIIMTAFDPHYLGLDDLNGICTFLKKPFGIDELFRRMDECGG